MDGQPPPGGYYGQPNWANDCPETGGVPPIEWSSDITLTNSQTQSLAEFLGNPTFTQSVTSYDPNNFIQQAHSTFNSDFTHDQNYSAVTNAAGQFHQSTSCPELGVRPVQQIQTSLSAGSLNEVPPMDNWTGDYNFTMEFNKAQDKTKATPWIFSTRLEKLFVSLDKACPIKINAHPSAFGTFRIRGQIVYSRAEDFKDNVERCINHQAKDPPQSVAAAHVLRCEDKDSTYITLDGRNSVIIPLKTPLPGSTSVTLCFRFMCLSSCIGSLNRRPTKLIFTLETIDGEPKGRYVCDVRVCSCPGRDIKSEEEKLSTEDTANLADTQNMIPIYLPTAGLSKGKTKKRKTTSTVALPSTNTSVDENDVHTFTVQIRGRQQYELIRDVVNRLLADPLLGNAGSQNEPVNNDLVKRFKKEP